MSADPEVSFARGAGAAPGAARRPDTLAPVAGSLYGPEMSPDPASNDTRAGAPSETARLPSVVLSPLQFWALFTAGWLVYAGILLSTHLLGGGSFEGGLLLVSAQITPIALPAVFVALARKRLFRPQPSALRWFAHLVGIGLGYAVAVTAVGIVVLYQAPGAEPMREELGNDPVAIVLTLMFLAFFFYAAFGGFIVWTESLERLQESRDPRGA